MLSFQQYFFLYFLTFFTDDHRKTKVKLVNQKELTFFKSLQQFITVAVLHLVIYLAHILLSGLQVLGDNLHASDLGMSENKGRSQRASTHISMRAHTHIYPLQSEKDLFGSSAAEKKGLFYTLKIVRGTRMGSWCILVYLK